MSMSFKVLLRSENGLLSCGMESKGKTSVPHVSYGVLAAGCGHCPLQCLDFLVKKTEQIIVLLLNGTSARLSRLGYRL